MSDEVKEGLVVNDEDEQPDELPGETEAAEWLGDVQIEAEQDIEADRRN